MRFRRPVLYAVLILLGTCAAFAEPPDTSYIYPAGAQRGTTVEVRVGGYYLHDGAEFQLLGPGVSSSPRVERTETIWFEGPVIPMPDSQRGENYPKDYLGQITVDENAAPGLRSWRVRTPQGITGLRNFVVGDLPEIVEREIDGAPIPQKVQFPVTINGRIFPREDVDLWTFDAAAGQTLTCEVNAARFGSPLDAHLQLFGPDGRRIAENDDTIGADPRIQFTAEVAGEYTLSIRDANLQGLQDRVYRLTITDGPWVNAVYPLGGSAGGEKSYELLGVNLPNTATIAIPESASKKLTRQLSLDGGRTNPFTLAVGDLPEYREEDPRSQTIAAPAILNGRILVPGETDEWAVHVPEGERIHVKVEVSEWGSPLEPVVETPLAEGDHKIRIHDLLASRGGPEFSYRLRVTYGEQETEPGFRIGFPSAPINLERGKSVKLKINVERLGALREPIELLFDNLPAGVTVKNNVIPTGKKNTQLEFAAEENAPLTLTPLTIRGKAVREIKEKVDGKAQVVRTEEIVRDVVLAEPTPDGERRPLLCVTVPTPFKFYGVFESKFAPRGSVHLRHYTIDRGGFEGPIAISLSDKQVRHLQGVTGPTIVVPPGETEFDYPVNLSHRLEIGRTSRTQLMAVGVVKQEDGSECKVAYSSGAQNDQIIVLTDPNRLNVAAPASLKALPGEQAALDVTVGRGPGLSGPVTVELIPPAHIHGVAARAIEIPADKDAGTLTVEFSTQGMGPFNQPVRIRATMNDERGLPVVNETEVTVVE